MNRKNYEEIIGERYGKLTIVGYKKEKGKKAIAICKCDCGGTKETQYTNLTIGKTMSCGCVLKESRLKNLEGREKHGLSGTKIFNVWLGMKERCYNKKSTNYVNYGNRGITVCQEWLDDFMNFYNWAIENGYKEELDEKGRNLLSIDRIDNGKGYSPENCRWVTSEIQSRNKRTTRFTLEDVERIEKAGKNTEQVRQRMLKHGLTLDEILKLPKYHRLITKVKTKILFNVYDLDGGYIKQLDGYEELAEFMGRSVKQMYASICKQAKTKTSRTKNKLDNQWYHVERVGIKYTDKQNEVILDDIKNFVDEV